jgi:hypothetical protein
VKFYSTVDLNDLHTDRLEEWQFFYNWHRLHSALAGHIPMEHCYELLDATPISLVTAKYEPKSERVRVRDYLADDRHFLLVGLFFH